MRIGYILIKVTLVILVISIFLGGCKYNRNRDDINNDELITIQNNDENEILLRNKNITENYIEDKILLGNKNDYYEIYKESYIKELYTNPEINEYLYSGSYTEKINEESIHNGKSTEIFPITSSILETKLYYSTDLEYRENLEDYFTLNNVYIDSNFEYQYKIKNYVNFFLDSRTLNMNLEDIKKIFISKNNYIKIFEKNFDNNIKVRIVSILNDIEDNSLIKPRINLIQTIKDDRIISVTSINPQGQTLEEPIFDISDVISINLEENQYLVLFGYNIYDPKDVRTEIHFYKLINEKNDLSWINSNIKLKETLVKSDLLFESEDFQYYIDGISFPSMKVNVNVSSEGIFNKDLLYDIIYEIESNKLFLITQSEILLKDSNTSQQFILYEIIE